MPKCRYCHEQLSRLDKDVCPFCGGRKPLEGVESTTVDITKILSPIELKKQHLQPRSKVTAFFLATFLGFLGAHEFYVGRIKKGFIILLISLLLIGGAGSAVFFLLWKNPLAYIIPYAVLEIIYLSYGIYLLKSKTYKDHRGEFLR